MRIPFFICGRAVLFFILTFDIQYLFILFHTAIVVTVLIRYGVPVLLYIPRHHVIHCVFMLWLFNIRYRGIEL